METILQEIINGDTSVFMFFNSMHNSFWDVFMSAYSGKWIWIPMYVAIAYVMWLNFSWKVTLLCMISVALVIVFADQGCATFIRPYVERLRPSNLNNPISGIVHVVDGYRGGSYGYPSCHAANTFGLAFFLLFLFRKRGFTWFIMGWALLTCYSRVYLGVHYPGDLLTGTVVGATGAYLIYRLFLYVSRYSHLQEVKHLYAPVWMGGLTVAGMLVYAALKAVG